jgi:chitinase
MTLLSGGTDYSVNPSAADITGFDPTRDRLDFGDISVHGLILGKLEDGSAVIVNPWQDGDFQRILTADGTALRWDQLTLDNIAPVGNEHLRADLGAVLSWENGVGPVDAEGTVYVRSHEYGVQERIEGFDPSTDKLNFLYLGTRERVAATDTEEGLLITVQPSQQSVLLVGVRSSELVGSNLEFHFDQIEEDNLEAVFGFEAADLTLVDRTVLLTPEAPAGATTDGYQTRIGSDVTSSGLPDPSEPMPSEHEMLHEHGMAEASGATGPLSLSASGSLYWGGMSGQLTITNTSATAVDGWQVSFETPHADFQSWAGDAQVESLDNGQYRVTLTPAAWNGTIAAGSSITVGFNAVSNGLPNSGELTSALFFTGDSSPTSQVGGSTALNPPPALIPEPEITPQPDITPQPEVTPEPEVVPQPDTGNSFSNGKRMVAYFEEWGIYSRDYLVQDIPVGDLTHINYSFFDVKTNGDVTLFDPWAATDKRFTAAEQVSRTFTAGEWSDLSGERQQTYTAGGAFSTRVNSDGSVTVSGVPVGWDSSDVLAGNLGQLDLLSQLHPEISLGIALGGWTLSDEFSLALDDANGRDIFTDNLITTLQTYDFFNTIDFDWEYPGGGGLAGNASSSQDGANFAATLQLLRQKLDLLSTETGERYEISVATAGGADKLANLNLSGLDPYVDFYNVMAYDFHGGWESTTGHQAAMTADPGGYDILTAVDQFRQNGVALNKVVLGAPAYTRAWGEVSAGDSYGLGESGQASAAPGSFEAGNYDQKDLITGIANDSYDLIWDDEAKAAFAYNENTRVWSSVETTATIAGKAAYVNEAGLGGMMFWALSNDAPDDQSLIAAASDVLSGAVAPELVAERSPGFDAVVGGDGAFSMSDFTDLA